MEHTDDKTVIHEYINLIETRLNYPSKVCTEGCGGEMVHVNNGEVSGYWCRNCGTLDDE